MFPERSKEKSQYRDGFEVFLTAQANAPQWLASLRERAFAEFERLGFPTIANEEWKYTNIAPLAGQAFRRGSLEGVDLAQVRRQLRIYPEAERSRLVFINGVYVPEFSVIEGLPAGVVVTNLAEGLATRQEFLEANFATLADFENRAFTALNTAHANDGALIVIPRGKVVETPINLFFVTVASPIAQVSFPRVLIHAGEASIATVVENFLTLGETTPDTAPAFTCPVTEIRVGDGANLEHYKVQKESLRTFHIANTFADLHHTSVLNSNSISLGGQIARNRIAVAFKAEGGEMNAKGLYYATGKQLMDSRLEVDHAVPNCTSQLLYKGMLDDKARGVFNGKVFVRHDAQGTNAIQTNKNLLLSQTARIDTKPQLEIFADDVKCGHGATVGQLSQDELFYLLSRGIETQAARNLLTYAFAHELVEHIKIESLKEELDRTISSRISSTEHGFE
ncbi:MAG: Fe-S cluster assembly protein SufD [Blastocatellia bacterium]|nr:Fe-S cluster assembly protein SufD [Blastocatellia bacterium]